MSLITGCLSSEISPRASVFILEEEITGILVGKLTGLFTSEQFSALSGMKILQLFYLRSGRKRSYGEICILTSGLAPRLVGGPGVKSSHMNTQNI